MRAARHWIIAHASVEDPAWQAELPGLALPALGDWLQQAAAPAEGHADPQALAAPHEQALARALGWPARAEGHPWAAWHAGRTDLPCAWLVPCHAEVSLDHLTLRPAQALALTAEEAQALRDAWAPLAQEEGITLTEGGTPWRWLAQGEPFDGWRSASVVRVAHRRLDPAWQPGAAHAAGRRLRRLLEEATMLWHTHPVNEERAARGLPPINALWVEGAGRWDGQGPPRAEAAVVLEEALADAALAGDLQGWCAAWRALDADLLAPALQAARQDGLPRWLTLCGERGWRTWRLDPSAPAAPPAPRWWPWRRRAAAPAVAQPWWIGL